MKCDTCGNEMVWKGSFLTGDLVCEYCEDDDDDDCGQLVFTDGNAYTIKRGTDFTIHAVGAGGGGGRGMTEEQAARARQLMEQSYPTPYEGCGDPDCDVCSPPKLETIKCTEERLPDGRIIRTPIIEPTRTTPYRNCEAAQKYMEYRRAELLRLREEEMLKYCMVDTTPFLSEQLKEQLRIDEVCFNLDLKGKFV